MGILQEVPPALLTGVLRKMIADEDQPENLDTLNPWFQYEEVDGIEYSVPTGTTRTFTRAAQYRAFDTSAPLGTRPGRGWAKGKILPISQGFRLGEQDQIKIREMAAARANGAEIDFQEILNGDVFDDLARGARALLNRANLGMAELLKDGVLTITENGVQLTYDPERDAARSDTAATPFSNAAAPVFAMERAILNTMRQQERLPWTTYEWIANQNSWDEYVALTEVKEAYQSNRALPRITDEQAVQVRNEQKLPPVRVIDTEIEDHNGVLTPLVPDEYWFLVPKPENVQIGRTQWGQTLAASKPDINVVQAGQGAPGPVAYMYDSEDPITMTLIVDGIMLPTMHDPDATFSWEVS